MTISKELLDELLSGVERPEDLLGRSGPDEGTEGPFNGTDAGCRAYRASWLRARRISRRPKQPAQWLDAQNVEGQ